MADTKENKQVETRNDPQRKPSPETLPPIEWLAVADLLVDYSYQHRPYAKAINDLNKEFQVAHSGFILVNKRTDGTTWTLDGQTRSDVHKLRGLRWIKAEILHGLTQAEEAEVYLIKCINAKRMPVDFFLAEYVAQRPEAVLIHDLLEKHGIEIESYATTRRQPGNETKPVVTCVSYLKRMIGRDPKGEALGMTLDLIKATWQYRGNTLTGIFLDTLHKMVMLHAAELDRKAFITKLENHDPAELREQALTFRAGTKPRITVVSALQHVIIDLYNSGRPQARRITLGYPHGSATV